MIPKLRFPEFKSDWRIKRLDSISNLSAGGTPSTRNLDYWGGHIKWMSSGDLNKGRGGGIIQYPAIDFSKSIIEHFFLSRLGLNSACQIGFILKFLSQLMMQLSEKKPT